MDKEEREVQKKFQLWIPEEFETVLDDFEIVLGCMSRFGFNLFSFYSSLDF